MRHANQDDACAALHALFHAFQDLRAEVRKKYKKARLDEGEWAHLYGELRRIIEDGWPRHSSVVVRVCNFGHGKHPAYLGSAVWGGDATVVETHGMCDECYEQKMREMDDDQNH